MSKIKESSDAHHEEIYKILADHSGDFIALHDAERKFLYASPSVEKILGYSPEELKGTSLYDFIHKEDQRLARKVHSEVLTDKSSALLQFRFKHKKGHYVWLETIIQVLEDEKGKSQRIILINRDISGRKKAEEILRESEEKYRILFETAIDAIFIIDLNTHCILDANKAASKLYGYSVEELKGLNVRDVSAEKEDTDKSLNEARIHVPVRYHQKKDGTVFPIEVNAASYKTTNRNLHVGIIRDITERLEAEEALKASEFKFRSLLDKIQCGVVVHNPDTGIVTVNSYAQKFLGYKEYELVGKYSENNMWQFLHTDGSKMPPEEYPVTRVINTKGPVRDYMVGIERTTDEKIRWALVNADPDFDSTGKITQIIVTFVDITERVLAEKALEETRKRLKILNDLTIEGIVLHENSFIKDSNPSLSKMLKTTKDNLIGDTIFSYIHTDDHDRIKQRLKEGVTEPVELKLVRKDGTVFTAEAETNQMELDGKTFRVVAVRDITKRKEAEMALVQSEQELREANITKDKFFSIIAHDLKSPFNILLGYSDLLLNNFGEFDDNERNNLVRSINETAQKTFNLVQNLLAWSRTQTNRIEFVPKEIEITSLISENVGLYIESAARKRIKLHYTPKSECLVFADPEMISTVLRNLINNAIKFTHRNGQVEIHCGLSGRDMVEITVHDNGIGISTEALSKIFKIDEEIVSRGTENETGTGLGLLLCKEFVEKNNGRIWVESEKDKGSTFYFTLPLAVTYDL